jgi:hypothetical protein
LLPCLLNCFFSSSFPTKICMHFSPPHTYYMNFSFHPPWFHRPSNIWRAKFFNSSLYHSFYSSVTSFALVPAFSPATCSQILSIYVLPSLKDKKFHSLIEKYVYLKRLPSMIWRHVV